MSRRRTDTLDSYEGIPLDSPERRLIQSRNAQRVYRAKKANRTRVGTPQHGQVPAQPAELQRIGSSSGSIVAAPSPSPTLPGSHTQYNNRTTTVGPFPSQEHLDLGDDDLISRMLADDPSCSTLDARYPDVPYGIASNSLDESGLMDAPAQSVSALAENYEPSQGSSRSATASSWGVDDFRSDFNLSYRPGEAASSSARALTSLGAPPNTGAVPPNLIPPNAVPARTLPHSPTSPTTSYPSPSYQRCASGTNTPSASREGEDLRSGPVWHHPIHTAAQKGHTRIIQLLLQSGCDVNLKDGTGSTPLHVAAAEGHAGVVRLLMNHGGDIDAVDNLGWTPIHLATRNGHTDCVELLLKLGI